MGKSQKVISTLQNLTASLAQTEPKAAAADPSAPAWVNHVAVLTGALAALAGFLTVRSTILTNEAIYESNQAILSQTQASDAWSEYQADSIKAHIIETQLIASPTLGESDRKRLTVMGKQMRDREPGLKQAAINKGVERETHLQMGQRHLGERDLLGYAGMAAQLGIALASVAALTRKKIIFGAGLLTGLIGAGLTAYVFISEYGMGR
jgi:hypothetical protein